MMDGRAVSNFILDVCEANGLAPTNLALQKILYFCHVWYLVKTGKQLIRHSFQAWKFGPVLPYVYNAFSDFDRNPITGRAERFNPTKNQMEIVEYHFDTETSDYLATIVNFYGKLSAYDLVELSHQAGGPWDQAWNHSGMTNPGMTIKDEDIVRFYKNYAHAPMN